MQNGTSIQSRRLRQAHPRTCSHRASPERSADSTALEVFTNPDTAHRDWTAWLTMQSSYEPVSAANSLLTGKITGNFAKFGPPPRFSCLISLRSNSLRNGTGNFQTRIREILSRNREFPPGGSFVSSRHALHSSGADRCADVHFTPKVDRRAEVSLRRLCANSGCAIAAVSRRSKRSVYSITSSARARSVGGTTVP